MRRIMLAFAAFTLVPLSACATAPVEINTKSTILDEKALYAAEAAYNTVASTYLTLVDGGQLTGATKDVVKDKLILAATTLKLLRAAYLTGDSADFGVQLVRFNTLVVEVKGLLS